MSMPEMINCLRILRTIDLQTELTSLTIDQFMQFNYVMFKIQC